jgi:hypothetical protein
MLVALSIGKELVVTTTSYPPGSRRLPKDRKFHTVSLPPFKN